MIPSLNPRFTILSENNQNFQPLTESTSPGPQAVELGISGSPEIGVVKSAQNESPPPSDLKSVELTQTSLNMSPTGTSSGVSSDSSHLSGLITGPITSAIAAATSTPLPVSTPVSMGTVTAGSSYQPTDYSNYYSAFYQTHPVDPNSSQLAQTGSYSHFPNHHFTVSSLIQKPSAAQLTAYPKL